MPTPILNPIRLVAFDVGGTLLTPDPPVGEVYAAVARARGVELPVPLMQQRFREFFARRQAEPHTSDALEREYWREMVQQVLRDDGLADECFLELYDHFAQPRAWRMFDDVAGVLQQLREIGLKIAVASNFDSRLHSVMNGYPALAEIDTRVISSEVGWRKPHENFYRNLVAQTRCAPGDILMVGDEYDLDVTPARKLGLQAVHLVREGKDSHERENVIRSLSEIPMLLDKGRA